MIAWGSPWGYSEREQHNSSISPRSSLSLQVLHFQYGRRRLYLEFTNILQWLYRRKFIMNQEHDMEKDASLTTSNHVEETPDTAHDLLRVTSIGGTDDTFKLTFGKLLAILVGPERATGVKSAHSLTKIISHFKSDTSQTLSSSPWCLQCCKRSIAT